MKSVSQVLLAILVKTVEASLADGKSQEGAREHCDVCFRAQMV